MNTSLITNIEFIELISRVVLDINDELQTVSIEHFQDNDPYLSASMGICDEYYHLFVSSDEAEIILTEEQEVYLWAVMELFYIQEKELKDSQDSLKAIIKQFEENNQPPKLAA